jgi:hypothetical protein
VGPFDGGSIACQTRFVEGFEEVGGYGYSPTWSPHGYAGAIVPVSGDAHEGNQALTFSATAATAPEGNFLSRSIQSSGCDLTISFWMQLHYLQYPFMVLRLVDGTVERLSFVASPTGFTVAGQFMPLPNATDQWHHYVVRYTQAKVGLTFDDGATTDVVPQSPLAQVTDLQLGIVLFPGIDAGPPAEITVDEFTIE